MSRQGSCFPTCQTEEADQDEPPDWNLQGE